MLKRILTLLLCLSICMLTACRDNPDRLSVESPASSEEEIVSEPVVSIYSKNPLTGIEELSSEKADDRPVAVMVNNISEAQAVQTGLSKADIIYETEVEGGITRLMAVFQDITKAEKVGAIRSARYVYVDLAMGHDAVYLHAGQDPKYCKPHLADLDDVDVDNKTYGVRISNGLSKEHTLYSYGQTIWSKFIEKGVKTERGTSAPWLNFADEEENITLETGANNITIPFSASYKTVMKYDPNTGMYTRYFKNALRKDYFTGETTQVKNVFILLTTIGFYGDGYHRNVNLQSGDGYYCVNGTKVQIKWKKGNAKDPIVFTNLDGTPLKVNAGNSWVAIANVYNSQPQFQ